ncbi:hypothetical protein BH23VER1_BH23VER1_02970 [soil metagenome]
MASPSANSRISALSGVYFLLGAVALAGGEGGGDTAAALEILQSKCLRCHSEDKRKGGLLVDSRESLIAGGDTDAAVVPGDASASYLTEVLFPDADPHMPPKGQLEPAEIQAIERWIDGGAPWDAGYWASLKSARQQVEVEVELGDMPGGLAPALCTAVSPDGHWLATGRGNAIELRDLSVANDRIKHGPTAHGPTAHGPTTRLLVGHGDLVQSLAWSRDGKFLASGGFREVRLWEAGGFEVVAERSEGLGGRITALAFGADSGTLVAADSVPADASQLHWWDTVEDTLQTVEAAHFDSIYDVEVSPDGRLLASAGADRFVHVRDAVTGALQQSLEGHTGYVMAVAFSPDSGRLVSSGDDASIKVWDLATGKRVSTFGGDAKKSGAVTGLAWMADESDGEGEGGEAGDRIIAVNAGGRPSVFTDLVEHEGKERSQGAREKPIEASGKQLTGLAFDPATGAVLAGTSEGDLLAWDKGGSLKTVRASRAGEAPRGGRSFRRDILPILTRAGCAAGACHAKADGQNGFQLSIFAHDPESDYREIVHDARGRRVFPAAPHHSLLLLKATHSIAHEGEERFAVGSEFYETIASWIRDGAPYSLPDEPVLAGIEVSPADAHFGKGEARPLGVTARYSDGSTREVTALSEFTSAEEAFASVDEDGVVEVGHTPGDGTIIVRYLDQVATARVTVPTDALQPPEAYAALPVANKIDELAYARFQKLGLLPSAPCSDAEFIRRATLDTLGRLPDPDEVRAFLDDGGGDKRQRLVGRLLGPENAAAYADYWATKWGDLLRPNTQRVGVKPVYLLDDWIRRQLRENRRYDDLVRELLTASGSTHEFGPVAVFRDKREPEDIAEFTSRIFLGTRIDCARCHHHPSERWGQDDYYSFAAFFRSMKKKGQGISAPISGLPEFWWFEPGGEVSHPVTGEVMVPKTLGGEEFASIPESTDPREILAGWMTSPDNLLFGRAIANRLWGEFFGRGLVDPVDDFRASNPAVNEPLLDWLAQDFIAHGYDLKHLIGRILVSHLYGQSSVPNATNLADTRNFSRAYRRRLPAEVLADSVVALTGIPDRYQGLADGAASAMRQWNHKLDSDFLDAFGRPDSSAAPPCERDESSSAVQALHLMNSAQIQRKFADAGSWPSALAASERPDAERVDEIYLAAYSRFPAPDEREVALAYFEAHPETAVPDLLWALINSAEFVFNH